MTNLDEETKKELTDAESVLLMTETKGWLIVRAKLVNRIVDLQSVKNVDKTSPEKALADVLSREAAVDILNDWLTKDIEGYIEQQQVNSRALTDTANEGFIQTHN